MYLKINGIKEERKSLLGLLNSNHRLEYPLYYNETADSILIETYFENILPRLDKTKRKVIIMDNASYHKSKYLKELFAKNNVSIKFLPPYSPDLNPIEKLWGTIKKQLRNYSKLQLNFEENLINAINMYCV